MGLRLWSAFWGRGTDPTAQLELFMSSICLLWGWVFLSRDTPTHPLLQAMGHNWLPIWAWGLIFLLVGAGTLLGVAQNHLAARGWMAAARFWLWACLAYFMAMAGQTTWRSYVLGALFCLAIDNSLTRRKKRSIE